jgi:hypothetical protein
MRLYTEADERKKAKINRCWHKALKKLQHPEARWLHARGPMTATICTLLDMGWTPIHPCKWLPNDTDDKQNTIDFNRTEGVTNFEVKHLIEQHLTNKVWKEAADDGTNSGYAEGKPILTAVDKAYKYLNSKGMHEEAKALQTVILNKSWTAGRRHQEGLTKEEEGEDASCTRCGAAYEDEVHRRWECKDNDNINHWAMKETKYMKGLARQERHHGCYWLKGIIPRGKVSYNEDRWNDYTNCTAKVTGNFEEILNKQVKAGTDGAEASDKTKAAMSVTAAAVVIDDDGETIASLEMQVPGRQTIPRAETWAVICLADKMEKDSTKEVFIDNASVVEGLLQLGEKKWTNGTNGDLWKLLDLTVKEKNITINPIKVKSHVTTAEE